MRHSLGDFGKAWQILRRGVFSVYFAVLFAGLAPGETLRYTLRPHPERHTLDVTLDWQTSGRTQSALRIAPRWGQIPDVTGLLKDLRIDARKVTRKKSVWVMRHRRNATIRVRYSVDPGRSELDWNSTYYPITEQYFFHGTGNAFLLTPYVWAGAPAEYDVLLRWELPPGWRGACSFGVADTIGMRLEPENLRESSFLAGRIETHRAEADGVEVTVAMLNEFAFSAKDLAERAARIVRDQVRFMREPSFPEFVITAIPVGEPVKQGDSRIAGSGLFHSFALYMAPQSTLTDAVEHLFAHEVFHYWNGRILTAEDPERLVYWFVEGFTDYYALRILYESGYWDAATFAKWINRHLREYDANPAKGATNRDILQRFWAHRDTVGEMAYQRGLLLALRWHHLARERGAAGGIDALFRALVERGRRGFRVSNAAIRRTGRQELGSWFGEEFDRYVMEPEPIAVPPDALAPDFKGRTVDIYAYELGFDRARTLKQQEIAGLKRGSAAAKAGAREGDKLVGYNIYGDTDRQIVLRVKRGRRIETIRYLPRGARRAVLQFRPTEQARSGASEGRGR